VLEQHRFRIAEIDGTAIRDEAALFDELRRALPMPDHFEAGWDALADALGDALEDAGRLAIVWHHADRSFAQDAQTFLDAVALLTDTARAVESQVEIFLYCG
jgi:RNAse (barnase) inhibitor barstar